MNLISLRRSVHTLSDAAQRVSDISLAMHARLLARDHMADIVLPAARLHDELAA